MRFEGSKNCTNYLGLHIDTDNFKNDNILIPSSRIKNIANTFKPMKNVLI